MVAPNEVSTRAPAILLVLFSIPGPGWKILQITHGLILKPGHRTKYPTEMPDHCDATFLSMWPQLYPPSRRRVWSFSEILWTNHYASVAPPVYSADCIKKRRIRAMCIFCENLVFEVASSEWWSTSAV
jgi:hypothetical protein